MERTRLAWIRTSLSFAVTTALIARSDFGIVGRSVVLALAASGTVVAWLAGHVRQREFAAGGQPRAAVSWIIAAPAGLTCVLGIACAVVMAS